MLSIIICSRSSKLCDSLLENISNTIGVEYEIIAIDNSNNQHSIFSAYNEGYAQSKFPFICFVHEDVLFHSSKWGELIIRHLELPKSGILGLSGGELIVRNPGAGSALITCEKITQSDLRGKKSTQRIHLPEGYNKSRLPVVVLDGVFLCMRRELMTQICFDEQLKGFHGYDIDISIQSTLAGYVNYVIYDIDLEHFSRGKMDIVYYRNYIRIFKKWEKYLPLCGIGVTCQLRSQIDEIERIGLKVLTKNLVRSGMSIAEISDEISFFTNLTPTLKNLNNLKNIRLQIIFIRLLSCPKYFFRQIK